MSISGVSTPRLDSTIGVEKTSQSGSRLVTSHSQSQRSYDFPTDTYTSSDHSEEMPSIDTVTIGTSSVSGPDVRGERVERIRAQISNGAYTVPASALAEAMMRRGVFKTDV